MRGGATIYDGKLFRETIDCHVVALDMKTGKEIWKQKFADYKEGYTGIIARADFDRERERADRRATRRAELFPQYRHFSSRSAP